MKNYLCCSKLLKKIGVSKIFERSLFVSFLLRKKHIKTTCFVF